VPGADDAFDSADRLLQDHVRVWAMVNGQDNGFRETPDRREVYFHKNCVVSAAFGSLAGGGGNVRGGGGGEGATGEHVPRARSPRDAAIGSDSFHFTPPHTP
jgi:hypothetical protein